jgi:hypothetical protein
MSTVVYRILAADGTPSNASGYPDELAVYTNPVTLDRKIRQLNDPNYLSPGAPQPKGRPYRRDTGRISWGNPL